MNLRPLAAASLLAASACLLSPALLAAPPKKKSTAAPVPPRPPIDNSPKAQLTPFINRIGDLLALQRPDGPFINGAPGKLAVLKTNWAARLATADPAEAPRLQAGIATADALSAALNERQQTYGQISANTSVKATGRLGRQRKDNFSQGTVGGDLTRTADVIEQARRERAQVHERKKEAAKDDQFMTSGSINRWNQRSLQLQQQIIALYAKTG